MKPAAIILPMPRDPPVTSAIAAVEAEEVAGVHVVSPECPAPLVREGLGEGRAVYLAREVRRFAIRAGCDAPHALPR